MILDCQKSALDDLKSLAEHDRHSILLEGVNGCGKTYVAKQYGKMLGIADFVNVPATVNDIRKSIDMCFNLDSKVVICIENLDGGVIGASYTLLKFLEEPRDNIYIVVTCCNINKVPDTIISRSSVVTLSAPTVNDLQNFARSYSEDKRKFFDNNEGLKKSVRNLWDVDYCMSINSGSYCDHLENLVDLVSSKKAVSDITWSLGHYPDNSEVPVKFAIKYIISNTADPRIKKYGIECIKDLDSSRIAAHAVLSKFVLNCKYGD